MVGSARLDLEIEKSLLSLSYSVEYIQKGDRSFDKFLSSADFIDSAKFPLIKIESQDIENIAPNTFEIKSKIQVNGKMIFIPLRCKFDQTLFTDFYGMKRTGLSFIGIIDPASIGLNQSLLEFTKPIDIELELEFTTQKQ